MDVSLEYVKMCEKAEEIQKQTPPPDGLPWEIGPITDRQGNFWNFYGARIGQEIYPLKGKFLVWLPRQDQLQEMGEASSVGDLLERFLEWEDSPYFLNRRREVFTSMEQLWLAFVMSTLYHKKWQGNEWKLDNTI